MEDTIQCPGCDKVSEESIVDEAGMICPHCNYDFVKGKPNTTVGKLKLSFVHNAFLLNGYILLVGKYIGEKVPMLCVYPCGCKKEITWKNFKSHPKPPRQCKDCDIFNRKHRSQKIWNKLQPNFIEEQFLLANCKLLDEYRNNYTVMRYVCECGRLGKISWGNFRRGKRCKQCGHEKTKQKQKYEYEYVRNYLATKGCILLDEDYINCKKPLNYICECGGFGNTTFVAFKKGQRCRKCAVERSSILKRTPIEYIRIYFKQQGCILLSEEYKNSATLLEYVCNCGDKSISRWQNFIHGQRCYKCGTTKAIQTQKYHKELDVNIDVSSRLNFLIQELEKRVDELRN